jgi:hypothetical protein
MKIRVSHIFCTGNVLNLTVSFSSCCAVYKYDGAECGEGIGSTV